MNFDAILNELAQTGNLRRIPDDAPQGLIDLSTNDYLGLGADASLRDEFFGMHRPSELLMTSSASRLLASHQHAYNEFESMLTAAYRRHALLFNSGYHANTGIITALASASNHTVIIADKLVHASIIDGIRLSGATFERFRHNDYTHLQRLVCKHATRGVTIIIIAESVYSMDGDRADIEALIDTKHAAANAGADTLLYLDEAHAVGVCGPAGLGLAAASPRADEIDIIIGTLGKALASSGAYAVASDSIYSFLVNRARSLIFSTALPPATVMWSHFMFGRALTADSRRDALGKLSQRLAAILGGEASHIQALVTGSAQSAVDLSAHLRANGYNVLPIRTPTVPPGTERLRFSLSAALAPDALDNLSTILNNR